MVQSEVKPKPNAQAIQSNSENALEYSYILLGQDSNWALPDGPWHHPNIPDTARLAFAQASWLTR